jgi:hypothetical protein
MKSQKFEGIKKEKKQRLLSVWRTNRHTFFLLSSRRPFGPRPPPQHITRVHQQMTEKEMQEKAQRDAIDNAIQSPAGDASTPSLHTIFDDSLTLKYRSAELFDKFCASDALASWVDKLDMRKDDGVALCEFVDALEGWTNDIRYTIHNCLKTRDKTVLMMSRGWIKAMNQESAEKTPTECNLQ